jgi:capsular exopolysaccharide synthesis family protein
MSRIYEALQRADRERKAAPVSEGDLVVEPAALAEVAELPSLDGEFAYERVAQHPWQPSLRAFPTLAERGVGVEQFRALRSRIYQARYEAPLKTILISSGLPSEGKSFVASNLAVALSRNGVNKILLIDGDLRRSALHNLLGTSNEVGLSDYLAGTAELSTIMQRQHGSEKAATSGADGLANLTFISAGKCADRSSELIANQRFNELIESVSPHFDWILIDSPPVLAVADAVELAHAADAVLLIARGASTPFEVAQRTQATFNNSRILGFVLNDVKDAPRHGSYYNYYYYKSSKASEHASN